MAEQHSGEDASTSDSSVLSSDSALDLNIKTLDSQIYNFQVDKNMLVSSFKEKIAGQIGVPVGQQRLIFRGKVLKDEHPLSEYHVENGDTLHLVERQPTQQQTSSGTGHADTPGNNGSQGNDASAGIPRHRIGQISHSVVLGTFNVGDQGEGVGSDVTRVIGGFLNSLGVGSQATTAAAVGAPNVATTNRSGPASQGSDAEQGHSSNGVPSQAQSQYGQPFISQSLHAPFVGTSIPAPSLNMPIPDSLSTMSEFISRMEEVLSQNATETQSSTSLIDQPARELPFNARGLPTPEALSIVMRRAERLLSGSAVASLSNAAGQLEQEAGSTDVSLRNQIQSDFVRVGLAMQHLGALFLELGRTILMLRMGQSPAEAVVNAGHAVYISPSGPNPIMVQPFPHQTSPLFNAPPISAPNSGTPVPVGIIGSGPRNINIHIHAGTSLTPMVSALGARNAVGENGQGERSGATAAGDSVAARVFQRNIGAAAVPSRAATIAVSAVPLSSQSTGGATTSQSPESAALTNFFNSRIRGFLESMRTENQNPSGQQENPVVPSSSDGSGGVTDTIDPSKSVHPECSEGASESPELQAHEGQTGSMANYQSGGSRSNEESHSVVQPSVSCSRGDLSKNSESNLKDDQTGSREVPLGLGGGLQPKKRSQQPKVECNSSEGGTSGSSNQSQRSRADGQQFLQSLLSRSTSSRTSSNDPGTGQSEHRFGQDLVGVQSDAQGLDGQMDVTGMMSQLLDNPALNGLLSGVAQQTGVGSPDVFRNMLQQFTQNPAMRNTVNQLAQQVNNEDVRNMFSGMGTGPGGGGSLDLSSMFQQMMPVVSQVLGGVQIEPPQNTISELPSQINMSGGDDRSFSQISLGDIQEVVQQITVISSLDIFHDVLLFASERTGTAEEGLLEGLSSNQELVDQFVETLRHDLLRRLQGSPASGDQS